MNKNRLNRNAANRVCLSLVLAFYLPTAFAATTEVFFFAFDQQASLVSVYQSSNVEVLNQAWSPWGVRADQNNASTQQRFYQGYPMRLGYTGHKQLLDSDLVLAGDTRVYDPKLKRFYNSDDRNTGGVRGMNRFSYAYNNPLTYVDPDGHVPVPTNRSEETDDHRAVPSRVVASLSIIRHLGAEPIGMPYPFQRRRGPQILDQYRVADQAFLNSYHPKTISDLYHGYLQTTNERDMILSVLSQLNASDVGPFDLEQLRLARQAGDDCVGHAIYTCLRYRNDPNILSHEYMQLERQAFNNRFFSNGSLFKGAVRILGNELNLRYVRASSAMNKSDTLINSLQRGPTVISLIKIPNDRWWKLWRLDSGPHAIAALAYSPQLQSFIVVDSNFEPSSLVLLHRNVFDCFGKRGMICVE